MGELDCRLPLPSPIDVRRGYAYKDGLSSVIPGRGFLAGNRTGWNRRTGNGELTANS